MIIDHIGLAVSDYDKSKQFFCRALAPLGIELVADIIRRVRVTIQ
jgi:catechol 2,3-dioxygenase-like lactoylglutathione lyase family enzyme